MPSSDSTERMDVTHPEMGYFETELITQDDILMEEILENVNNTPLGQVLKRIASLPEVRQKKVLDIRRSIATGQYELDNRLDAALDRVLEQLIE